MKSKFGNLFNVENLPFLLGVFSLTALLLAYGVEQFGGIFPCHLCIYQRYVYQAILCTAFVPFINNNLSRFALLAQLVLLLCGIGLSVYHIGVEQKWWESAISCAAPLTTSGSIEMLEQAILQAPLVRCDEINWAIAGVSATIWNLVFQLVLMGGVYVRVYNIKSESQF